MKKIIDTSAWIELLIDSKVGSRIRQLAPKTEEWVVPTIIQLELEKWALRNLSDDEAAKLLSFSNMCVVLPLSTDLAVEAAKLCLTHKLATADAIIYATAQAEKADLLTCDAHFKDLPGVVYHEK